MIALSKVADIVAILKAKYPNSQIAFTPSLDLSGAFWRLSIVEKDIPGHDQLAWQICHGTREVVQQMADRMNDELKLTKDQARHFVASSMKGAL